jgi:molecular chaperone DnaK
MSGQGLPVVVGIDLGTTYSCIARVDEHGKPEVIKNREGNSTTPSVILFEEDSRVVGDEARNIALAKPEQIVQMVKRQMGDRDWRFRYQDKEYSAEEISSYILRKVVGDAEEQLGATIKDVVITCPAYFGIPQRDATALAGELAGLNVLSIINEPTAAAIDYGLLDSTDQVVLIYDLGGGTFDITMIEIKGGNLTVVATGGDHNLGGRQWDERLVQYLADRWKAETGSSNDPLDSLETTQDLFDRAERGKRALTTREKTDISVQHAGERVAVPLTREKFDELTADLLGLTIQYTRQMLEQAAAKGYQHFDQILLVGGSTRMTQVQQRVAAEFNTPQKMFDPDEAVAKGAAVYAVKIALDREFEKRFGASAAAMAAGAGGSATVAAKQMEQMAVDLGVSPQLIKGYGAMTIKNVTSRSFGVVAWQTQPGGPDVQKVTNLIQINTQLPTEGKAMFGTYTENQQQCDCEYVESLLPLPEINPEQATKIGEAILPLPANLPKASPIEITFRLDDQGRLKTTARDVSTNRVIDVEIKTEAGLSEQERVDAKARSTRLVVS